MTTIAYINGELACDTLYSFPVKQSDSSDEKLTSIAKTTLFNSEKYLRFHVPKAIKYVEKDFEIICGTSSEARFSALTHDCLQHNYGNIGLHLDPNHPEYIIDELTTVYEQLYSGLSRHVFDFSANNPPDVPLLYLLFVVNGISSVYYYLPEKKSLILDKDQFPVIGTGRDYVKEYVSSNPNQNAIEAVAYAIKQDDFSGFPIQASSLSEPDNGQNLLPLTTAVSGQPSNYRNNLDEGISQLGKEIIKIKEKMLNFKNYIK